jgi:MFS-type transporter involved in bile tolerance (Atg22 family)
LTDLLATAFLALLFGVVAFCGVAWAEPAAWTGAAAAGAVFLVALFPPFLGAAAFLILFEAPFLMLLVTFFVACALAIIKFC